jgi:iron complex transport system permease protein
MKHKQRNTFIILILLFLVASAFEICLGPMTIPFGKIGPETWNYFTGTRSPYSVVIGAIRWPRLFTAAFVGIGLASTGAVLQAVFRNPMADPAIIGVSSGGALGAVLTIQLGLAQLNEWFTPLGAFVSGLTVVYIIYRLATIRGKTAIYALLLAGVAISSLSSAIVTLMLSLAPLQTMQKMLFWLMGGLDGSTWTNVYIVGSFTCLGLILYMVEARALDILSIGEEQAEGLGVHLQHTKQTIFAVAAIVVGACVSVSGVIAFVGLIVPHLIRMLVGPKHRLLIPASALGGAILMIVSDLVGRMVLQPLEINVGIITSCLGAPFFLYLLRKSNRTAVRG